MVGANTLVNNAILQLQQGSTTDFFQNKISPEYQEAFTLDNLFSNLGDVIGFLTLLPLLLIFIRQTYIMLYEKESKIR